MIWLICWATVIAIVALTGWAIRRYPTPPEDDGAAAKFRCRDCGRLFDPDPRMIVECTWAPRVLEADEDYPDGVFTLADVADASDEELLDVGIDPEDREKILRGEQVETSACICIECQDKAQREEGSAA